MAVSDDFAQYRSSGLLVRDAKSGDGHDGLEVARTSSEFSASTTDSTTASVVSSAGGASTGCACVGVGGEARGAKRDGVSDCPVVQPEGDGVRRRARFGFRAGGGAYVPPRGLSFLHRQAFYRYRQLACGARAESARGVVMRRAHVHAGSHRGLDLLASGHRR